MKTILLASVIFIISCNNNNKTASLERAVDSLKNEIDKAYKPGLGEFMSSIQIHHAKLWFAGINSNWQLADFEIHEILEAADDIENYCPDRPEAKAVKPALTMAIDSLNESFKENSVENFKKAFSFLTTACNNCHKEYSFAFNVVTMPNALPVPNQAFAPVLIEKFDSTKRHLK